MAKVILNPLLLSIHGRFGNVVFYRTHGKNYVRRYVIPHNPNTEEQRIVRYTFANAVKSWQVMSQNERYKFNRKARNMNMSGYNLYISAYMKTSISATLKDYKPGNSNGVYSSGIHRPIPSLSAPSLKANWSNILYTPIQYCPG